MKKIELFLLLIILLGAFAVRLYRFDNPILDWHAWRQADTSAVSRNFVKEGIDLLHPQFDDLSNVPSGKDNPNGYRFVEFPIYNLAQASFYSTFHMFTLEEWGRLVTIISSVFSTLFLFLLVRKHASNLAGFLAAGFYAFLPFSIYYGRVILPDPTMVMASLGGIYLFDTWISSLVILRPKAEESRMGSFASLRMTLWFILAILFTLCAFLLKPYALFFTLPMIYLAYQKWGLRFLIKPQLWLFAAVTLVPLVGWRLWMQQFPAGIPVSDWLFNGGNIRFKGAFFYWIFADRIGRLILGYWGIGLLALGLISKLHKQHLFFISFLLSSLIYLTVLARGNVQHDYYQILILPTIAIFAGLGAEFLLKAPKEYFSKTASYLLLITCCAFTFFFSWYFVRDYFNINNRAYAIAGKAVDFLTPSDAKVIALNEGDTSFLYQTNRKGWASFEKSPEEMVKMGAQYLILANPTKNDFEGFGRQYKIISSTQDYLLLDFTRTP